MKKFNPYDSYSVIFPKDSPHRQWNDQRIAMKQLGVTYTYANGRSWNIICSPEVLTLLILKLNIIVE